VINEIAWAGTGSSATTSKDEWVELYNPTPNSVSLSGMLRRLKNSGVGLERDAGSRPV
jgi:hypothetical protein